MVPFKKEMNHNMILQPIHFGGQVFPFLGKPESPRQQKDRQLKREKVGGIDFISPTK